jgi:hypothetical protein
MNRCSVLALFISEMTKDVGKWLEYQMKWVPVSYRVQRRTSTWMIFYCQSPQDARDLGPF